MSYMTKVNEQRVFLYGEKFVCHQCGRDAMFMDSDKKWYCYFNWYDLKENHGICKANKNK
jgi:hypothetical protein